jgi:hypothetical protein
MTAMLIICNCEVTAVMGRKFRVFNRVMQNSDCITEIIKRPVTRYFGLVTRVAKRLGKSKALVSMVKNGRVKSRAVQLALESERKLMRAEQAVGREES